MTSSDFITVSGKSYEIRTLWDGRVQIFARWEAFNVSERNLVCRSTVTRTKQIDPHGRVGKRVLAANAAALGERICATGTMEADRSTAAVS